MGQTLAEVLRGHWCLGPDVRTSAPICRCEWRGERIHGRDDTWADQHADHLADVVTAWLGTDAGDIRDYRRAYSEHVDRIEDLEERLAAAEHLIAMTLRLADEWDEITVDDEWHAADLWAEAPRFLRGTLRGAQGVATGEVGSGSTGDANGAQIAGKWSAPTYEDYCPKCGLWKFIGHGSLCVDCYCSNVEAEKRP